MSEHKQQNEGKEVFEMSFEEVETQLSRHKNAVKSDQKKQKPLTTDDLEDSPAGKILRDAISRAESSAAQEVDDE